MKQMQKEKYDQLASKHRPKPKVFWNGFKAFLVGGIICTIGQGLQMLYEKGFQFDKQMATSLTAITLVFLSCLLTGFGIYDHIGQWAGMGSAVPVTGFANAVASAALEHKSEGYVLGVGGKMFKLAGSVIVFGAVSAFFVSLVHTLVKMMLS
jgi:stage V sporulation protein AC